MSTEKLFVGNAKVKTNKFGDKEINVGFQQKDLDLLQQHLNEKGWVNFNVKSNKEGKPYLQIDTWQPTERAAAPANNAGGAEPEDELPF